MTDAERGHHEIGIIGLPPERWGTQWQTRHQLLARLARRFPTVWVNPEDSDPRPGAPDGGGEPMWRQAETAPQLTVYTPPAWMPYLRRPAWAAARFDRARLGWARRRLLGRGVRRIVLSVWRPRLARRLDLGRYDAVLYHVDDEYSYRPDPPAASPVERDLLGRATSSYFSSRALLERKGPLAQRAVFLPNGVDYQAFANPGPEPADLASIPRPRIGYTGWVKKQLDWALIEALAQLRPDLSFIFVGDVSPHPGLADRIAPLRSYPNVHFLGGKSTTELAAYPAHFDVCTMPYVVDGYTRFIYPLKLHEYFASGQPAIGSPIPALMEFHPHVVIADGPDDWSAAIDHLLAPEARSPSAREARQAVARAHDWDVLADRVASDILAFAGGG